MSLDQTDYTELNRGEGGDKMATSTDGVVKSQNVRPVFGLSAGGLQAVSQEYPLPIGLRPIDINGVIGQNIGDTFVWTNPCSYASIGFHLIVPTGGVVAFEGSFDEVHWTSITLREISANGFRNHSHIDEDFIGSISNLRAFRLRTIEAGSAPGSIVGRVIHSTSTLEGIEHGNPPHQVGVPLFRVGVDIQTDVSDQIIFTPTQEGEYLKYVVSGYQLSLSGTGDVSIFDETNSADNWIFAANVKIGATESQFVQHTFTIPFISSAPGNSIKVTTTDTAVVKGVITGYQIA